jgi:hypothetical protein
MTRKAYGALIRTCSAESLDQAAQMMEDDYGAEVAKDVLAKLLTLKTDGDNNIIMSDDMKDRLQFLRDVPFKAILTTNFDTIIPNSVSIHDPAAAELKYMILRDPPLTLEQQFRNEYTEMNSHPVPVLQLHGSILDPPNMVCTRRGYRKM